MMQNCPSCLLLSMTIIGSSYYDGMCALLGGCVFTAWGWADLSRRQMRTPKDSSPFLSPIPVLSPLLKMMSKEMSACLETPRTLPLSCSGFPAWPGHGLEGLLVGFSQGCWTRCTCTWKAGISGPFASLYLGLR